MKEQLLIQKPRLSKDSRYLLDSMLHNDEDQGWPFFCGDPEIWKYSDQLIKKDGLVLDMGIGMGRSSMFFALHGMNVEGYDRPNNPYTKLLEKIAKAYRLPFSLRYTDELPVPLEQEKYDVAMLGQFFIHFYNKKDAFAVLDSTIKSLKPGGYLWMRTSGKEDGNFHQMQEYAEYDPSMKVQDDVYMTFCGCSGQMIHEPHLFLSPLEVLYHFNSKNMSIIHSQVAPTKGIKNIMYGGDDLINHPMEFFETSGVITVLAQKK